MPSMMRLCGWVVRQMYSGMSARMETSRSAIWMPKFCSRKCWTEAFMTTVAATMVVSTSCTAMMP